MSQVQKIKRYLFAILVSALFVLAAHLTIIKPFSEEKVDPSITYVQAGDLVTISTFDRLQVSLYSTNNDPNGTTRLLNLDGNLILETVKMAGPDYYEANGILGSGTYTITGNSAFLKINDVDKQYLLSNPNYEKFLAKVFIFITTFFYLSAAVAGVLAAIMLMFLFGIKTSRNK